MCLGDDQRAAAAIGEAELPSPPKRRSRQWNSPTARLQVVDAEFGPHPVGEPELGVGAFPQQEIRQPLFPAGADQQIDLRRAVVVLARLGDEAAERAGRRRGGAEHARGVDDGLARGVVERDPEPELLSRGGGGFGGGDVVDELRRQSIAASDDGEPDVVFDQPFDLGRRDRSAAALIRPPTSSRGRRQLSAENANSVSLVMPSPGAASATRRTVSTPAR